MARLRDILRGWGLAVSQNILERMDRAESAKVREAAIEQNIVYPMLQACRKLDASNRPKLKLCLCLLIHRIQNVGMSRYYHTLQEV